MISERGGSTLLDMSSFLICGVLGRCKADLEKGIKLGEISVSCEGLRPSG